MFNHTIGADWLRGAETKTALPSATLWGRQPTATRGYINKLNACYSTSWN
jgi:hypothetical protein